MDGIFKDADAACYDLSGFHFPRDGWKIPVDVVDKPIYALNAVFHGNVGITQKFMQRADFANATFKGTVRFSTPDETRQFRGDASFHKTGFKEEARFIGGFQGGADFRGAHFFKGVKFGQCGFDCGVDFAGVRFDGATVIRLDAKRSAKFASARFSDSATFWHSIFRDDVDFSNAEFEGPVDFRLVRFGSESDHSVAVSFHGTIFKDECDFTGAQFFSETSFNLASFQTPSKVSFDNVDLARVKFNRCDISDVILHNAIWSREKHKWWHKRRDKVYDEVLLWSRADSDIAPTDCESVAQTYRWLQANFGRNYKYPEAGDFYVGEQEMKRISRGGVKKYWSLSWAYKMFSNYGESWLRSFIFLIVFLLLFPLILGVHGMEIESREVSLEFGLSSNPLDFVLLKNDYWELFFANLDLVSLRKGSAEIKLASLWQKPIIWLEFVLFVSLITFFLLALRRRFKRKSF